MRTGRPLKEITVSDEERTTLEQWARRPKTAQRLSLRSRIVLSCASGLTNTQVAKELRVTLPTVGKWRRFRQPLEPRGDPAAVLLRELFCLLHAAARRHGEHHLARRGVDAQRITPCLTMAAHADEIDRLVENDLDDRRLTWTAIEQRTKRHGRNSTL